MINGPSKNPCKVSAVTFLTVFTTVGDNKGRKAVKQSDKDLWLWGCKSSGFISLSSLMLGVQTSQSH